MKRKDITGQRFGRLVAVCPLPPRRGNSRWLCRCDCGTEKSFGYPNLTGGSSQSCGCLAREMTSRRSTTHGHATPGNPSPEYVAWQHMKKRCENENSPDYARYGGRGITVCDRWRNSFDAFLADMGPRPGPGYTVERVDNSQGYAPENCVWRDRTAQANNRRTNHLVTFRDRTQTLAEWARETGIPYDCLKQRLNKLGWTAERALTTPLPTE